MRTIGPRMILIHPIMALRHALDGMRKKPVKKKNTADYVAFGAMFSSPTKPEAVTASLEIISAAKQQLSIPVCVIGGINGNNIHQVVQRGADITAVISSLFSADDIKHREKKLSQ